MTVEEKKKEAKGDRMDVDEDNKPIKALTEEDVRIMQAYGAGSYTAKIKSLENEIKSLSKKVNELAGIKESDTGNLVSARRSHQANGQQESPHDQYGF